MMRALLFLTVVGCSADTFTSGNASTGMDGSTTTEAGFAGCVSPCLQVASVDFPACLEQFSSNVLYATDMPPLVVGRVDKNSLASMTSNLPNGAPAADCAVFGSVI